MDLLCESFFFGWGYYVFVIVFLFLLNWLKFYEMRIFFICMIRLNWWLLVMIKDVNVDLEIIYFMKKGDYFFVVYKRFNSWCFDCLLFIVIFVDFFEGVF